MGMDAILEGTVAELTGSVVLITGGCGDLGLAISARLVRAGAFVCVNDRIPQEQAAIRLTRVDPSGTQIHYYPADVTDRPAVDAMIEEIVSTRGRLDIAICNAGIVESAPFLDVSLDSWQRHIASNLTGVFNTAQAAARSMVAQRVAGRILLTGSWVGEVPWLDIAPYSVSKAGVRMLGRSMAKELAPLGIRVNIMSPGIVGAGMAQRQWDTEPAYRARASTAIPLGELQQPASVAEAMLWLCLPASDYMTGAVLLVDGGASLFGQE